MFYRAFTYTLLSLQILCTTQAAEIPGKLFTLHKLSTKQIFIRIHEKNFEHLNLRAVTGPGVDCTCQLPIKNVWPVDNDLYIDFGDLQTMPETWLTVPFSSQVTFEIIDEKGMIHTLKAPLIASLSKS